MLFYLSKSIVLDNIMKPLNDVTIQCYSVHNEGSSSAKTMDEKELFIMKTAHKVEVKFCTVSLEEPDEANAEGLKAALETSIMKLGVNIERKNGEGCTLISKCSYFCGYIYLFSRVKNCISQVLMILSFYLLLNSFLKRFCFAWINLHLENIFCILFASGKKNHKICKSK